MLGSGVAGVCYEASGVVDAGGVVGSKGPASATMSVTGSKSPASAAVISFLESGSASYPDPLHVHLPSIFLYLIRCRDLSA